MKTSASLNNVFQTLRMTALPDLYPGLRKQAESEGLGYDEFLLLLLHAEEEHRQGKKVERLLRQSKLPAGKTLENFDDERISANARRKIKGLLNGDFLARNENILVFGQPGSGKTHLVCGIAHELVRQGYRILFTTAQLLVQDLLVARRDLWLRKQIKRLSGYDAVIIDDIGYVQQSRDEMEVLFTLLAERYETGSVMLTSNLPFSKWEQIFKDPMTTAAAIDRLVHHSVVLELTSKSYRMEVAKSKNTKEK